MGSENDGDPSDLPDNLSGGAGSPDPFLEAIYERLLAIMDIKEAITTDEPWTDPDLTATGNLVWTPEVYTAEAETLLLTLEAVDQEEVNGTDRLRSFYQEEVKETTSTEVPDPTELIPRSLYPFLSQLQDE